MAAAVWQKILAVKEALLMVVVQVLLAMVQVFYKLAALDGMNSTIIIAYRFIFATAFLTPIAFFAERKERPKMTWSVLLLSFGCGVLGGALGQNVLLEALKFTTVTYVSAMTNLVPAFTFIIAVLIGLEKLEWGSITGKAKVLGTLTGIGGALILIFVKGVEINISTNINLGHTHTHPQPNHDYTHAEHVLGCSLAALVALCFAIWLILQKKVAERYPCHYSSTALMCTMAMVQGVVVAIIIERDWNQWKLGWNIRFLTAVFTGVIGSGVCVVVTSYCTHLRGPVFVSSFNPLMIVVTAIAGALLLQENLHLGSIIGATIIICGIYMVLWAKHKEMKQSQTVTPVSEGIEDVEASTSPGNNNANDSNKDKSSHGKLINWCLH